MDTWVEKDDKLQRSFRFKDPSQAWAFMCRVALMTGKMDHHPEWSNPYNSVHIALCTHGAGGKVTDKDRAMARAIDLLLPP